MPTPLTCRHDEWNRHSCLYELLEVTLLHPPYCFNTRITAVCPIFSAHALGRAHGSVSASTGSAPRSSNAFATDTRPQRQAQPRGVLFRISSRTSDLAPASRRAAENGVASSSVT